VAVDFETTGVRWPYHAVEVAWIVLDGNLRELNRVSSLIRPPSPIPREAAAIHGISNQMVADSPSLDEFIMEECGNPFGDQRICFVAHSAQYDFRLFSPYCRSASLLCTLSASRKTFPSLPNHKLPTLADFLKIPVGTSHRAADDVAVAAELLRRIQQHRGLSLEQLIKLGDVSRGPETMPFGKYKGVPITNIPQGYLLWLTSRLESDDPLKRAVDRAIDGV
jgi:DNA polymerase III epsilon subunit-like protein